MKQKAKWIRTQRLPLLFTKIFSIAIFPFKVFFPCSLAVVISSTDHVVIIVWICSSSVGLYFRVFRFGFLYFVCPVSNLQLVQRSVLKMQFFSHFIFYSPLFESNGISSFFQLLWHVNCRHFNCWLKISLFIINQFCFIFNHLKAV